MRCPNTAHRSNSQWVMHTLIIGNMSAFKEYWGQAWAVYIVTIAIYIVSSACQLYSPAAHRSFLIHTDALPSCRAATVPRLSRLNQFILCVCAFTYPVFIKSCTWASQYTRKHGASQETGQGCNKYGGKWYRNRYHLFHARTMGVIVTINVVGFTQSCPN